jgi:hypothetical protein
VPASTRRDWEEKTIVNGRPAREFAEEATDEFNVSRDLPGLFDDEDDEPTLGSQTLPHAMPSGLVRETARRPARSTRPPPKELPSLVIAVDVDEDAGEPPVTHSGFRNVAARLRSVRPRLVRRWVWLVAPAAILAAIGAVVALLATR